MLKGYSGIKMKGYNKAKYIGAEIRGCKGFIKWGSIMVLIQGSEGDLK